MAARSWSYLLWARKLIYRRAPKKMGLGFDSRAWHFFFSYQVPGMELCTLFRRYKVPFFVWRWQDGSLLLRAAQKSLSNVGDVARCQLRYHHFFSWRRMYTCTHALSRMQTNVGRKGNIVDHALRLLCTWHRVGIYGVFETYRITHSHSRTQHKPGASVAAHTAR